MHSHGRVTNVRHRTESVSCRLAASRTSRRSPVSRSCPRQIGSSHGSSVAVSSSARRLESWSVSSFAGNQNFVPMPLDRGGQVRGGHLIEAVFKKYSSARAMRIRVSNENPLYPYETYFQDAERVVKVTFPDEERREPVAPGVWKVRLLPIQLLFFTFTAENTLKAWTTASGNGLNLTVLDLVLNGVPPQLGDLNDKLRFDLKGQLRVKRDLPGQARLVLDGVVAMELEADVPNIIAANPTIDQLCQNILDRILQNLEQSLVAGVTTDYQKWAGEMDVQRPYVQASSRVTVS